MKPLPYPASLWLKTAMAAVAIVLLPSGAPAASSPEAARKPPDRPAFPLRASPDGRYLVDALGTPFFYHADTAWLASKRLSLAEFEAYLDRRVRDGFTAIHLHAFSKQEPQPVTAFSEEEPFLLSDRPTAPDGHDPHLHGEDLLRPNEDYWRRFDTVLAAVEQRGLLAVVAPLWIRWGGKDTQGWRWQLRDHVAEPYGRWIAGRYRHHRNILWVLGGDANPIETTRALDLMGRGLKAAAPHHLVTMHLKEEFASSAYFDASSWLDVNFAYTYREAYIQVLGEWNRLGKPRPIVLSEARYEAEGSERSPGTPHRVRRQAYHTILSGGLGGHAYGHKSLWIMDAEWRTALDAPGSLQMAHVKTLFATRPWWRLRPDQAHEIVTGGYGYFGDPEYVTAAWSEEDGLAIAYLPRARKIAIDLGRLAGPGGKAEIAASWFDPTNGATTAIETFSAAAGDTREFAPPGKNHASDQDWVLVLQRRNARK